MQDRAIVITRVYAAGFAIGVATHARDFALGGPRPYAGAPPWLEIFWSGLLPVDAALVLLLLSRRRRLGACLGLLVMGADVAINTYAVAGLGYDIVPALVLQSIFLGVIFATLHDVLLRDR